MIFQKFKFDMLDELLEAVAPSDNQKQLMIREQLLQPGLNPESNCILLQNDENTDLLGCVLMSREDLIGRVILDFWIVPGNQGDDYKKDIVKMMLKGAIKNMDVRSGTVVHSCLTDLNYGSVFEQLGFSLNRTYWKMYRVTGNPLNLTLSEGLHVSEGTESMIPMLTNLQNSSFTGSWGFCPNTPEQITYKLYGSNTNFENVIFLSNDTEAIGYCWTYKYEINNVITGAISMIGVSPNYRGKGMSKGLLNHGLNKLVAQGCEGGFLEVDSNNKPAINIYEAAGFLKTQEMYWYELSIKN